VTIIAGLWRGQLLAAAAIGMSIAISLTAACLWGLSVPWILHACRLDPKIAAGPVTLALADLSAVLTYFALAAAVL
jgi:magnesium transporter